MYLMRERERTCQSLLGAVTALVSLNPHRSRGDGSYNSPILQMIELRRVLQPGRVANTGRSNSMLFVCCDIPWRTRAGPGVMGPWLPQEGASWNRPSVGLGGRRVGVGASGLQCWPQSRLCADCIWRGESPLI